MNSFLFANNAGTVLGAPINNSTTSITLATGTGSLFPSPASGEQFTLCLTDAATKTNREICYCTSRTGDVCTVLRGQEGTTAQSWLSGDIAANLLTAGTASYLENYNAGFAGAVTRTIASKLQECFSVLDAGAIGDRVAVDTSYIAAVILTGKKIYFPEPSSGYLSGAQAVATQGQSLVGDGLNTIIQATAANFNLFTVQATYCQFSEMRLNGAAVSNATTSFAIFTSSANQAQFLKVLGVAFSGASSGVGFNSAVKYDDTCHYGLVSRCIIERLWGIISGTGYGVLMGNIIGGLVESSVFLGSAGRMRHAIYFSSGCSFSKAVNNHIDSTGFESISQFSQGVQPACQGNIYEGNTITNAVTGGNTSSGAIGIYGHSFGAQLNNNYVSGSNQKGYAIDGTGFTDLAETSINGGHVVRSATIGIDLISAVRANLNGVTVYESSQSSAGTHSNIRLTSDGTTATSEVLLSGVFSSGIAFASSAFELNANAPIPENIKAMGNFFPMCVNYSINNAAGSILELDGGIRFLKTLTGATVANGASFSETFTVNGTLTGDYCSVALTDDFGCSVFARGSASNSVKVTVTNNTGSSQVVSGQTISGAVWKTDL